MHRAGIYSVGSYVGRTTWDRHHPMVYGAPPPVLFTWSPGTAPVHTPTARMGQPAAGVSLAEVSRRFATTPVTTPPAPVGRLARLFSGASVAFLGLGLTDCLIDDAAAQSLPVPAHYCVPGPLERLTDAAFIPPFGGGVGQTDAEACAGQIDVTISTIEGLLHLDGTLAKGRPGVWWVSNAVPFGGKTVPAVKQETYLLDTEIERVAAAVRDYVARDLAAWTQGTNARRPYVPQLSIPLTLSKAQKAVLARLSVDQKIIRALEELHRKGGWNPDAVADVVVRHLKGGAPVLLWDADGLVETMGDVYHLSTAEHGALADVVVRQLLDEDDRLHRETAERLASEAARKERAPNATERPGGTPRPVPSVIPSRKTPKTPAAQPASPAPASGVGPWPWVGAGVLLFLLSAAAVLRRRRAHVAIVANEGANTPVVPDGEASAQPTPTGPNEVLLDPVSVVPAEIRTPPRSPATTDPFIGTVLADRYTIEERIGAGGMGAVYRAVQKEPFPRSVAVKLLFADGDLHPSEQTRFRREAAILFRLSHPHIVSVYDFGELTGGQFFLVMEYIRGTNLGRLLQPKETNGQRQRVVLPVQRAIWIARQLLSALAVVHAEGYFHRDLKPANLILRDLPGMPDHLTLVDFGIAKAQPECDDTALTQPRQALGTPYYMAPEQVRSEPVDARTDLYAVGMILYEMLSGRRPAELLNVETKFNWMVKLHQEDLDIPRLVAPAGHPPLPDGLVRLVHAALSHNPEERPPDAATFLKALDAVAQS